LKLGALEVGAVLVVVVQQVLTEVAVVVVVVERIGINYLKHQTLHQR